MNELLLSITVGYGVIYGVKNMLLRIQCILTGSKLLQSSLGGLLDGMFISFILYFALFQKEFVYQLIDNIN